MIRGNWKEASIAAAGRSGRRSTALACLKAIIASTSERAFILNPSELLKHLFPWNLRIYTNFSNNYTKPTTLNILYHLHEYLILIIIIFKHLASYPDITISFQNYLPTVISSNGSLYSFFNICFKIYRVSSFILLQ